MEAMTTFPLPTDDLSKLHSLFTEMDEINQQLCEDHNVTCSKGCGYCCGILVTIPFLEAVNIVNEMRLAGFDLVAHAKVLMDRIPALMDDLFKVGVLGWRRNCVHLDADNACSIHPFRSSVCRKMLAVSPPEDCRGSPHLVTTKKDIMSPFAKATREFETRLGGSFVGLAPLEIMEAVALRLFSTDVQVREVCRNVPSPQKWNLSGGAELISKVEKMIPELVTAG